MNICLLASVAILLIGNSVNAQECKITPDPNKLAYPEFDPTSEYLAVIGRNRLGDEASEELTEYYNGDREISVESSLISGVRLKTFAYYRFSEVLILLGEICDVHSLAEAEELGISPMSKESVNGKNISVSPIGLLINKDLNFVYTGNKNKIRGRSVNEWQVCYKRDNDNAIIKLTYSFYEKTPFQLKKEIQKNSTYGYTEVYTITEFKVSKASYRMSTENWKEDDNFPPPGIFCKNKQQTFPLPTMPKSFSFEVEANAEDNDKTLISTFRFEYNFDAKIFRSDYRVDNGKKSEILDLNTGVKYAIDGKTGSCEVSRISKKEFGISGDSKFSIADPQGFFQFDDSFVFIAFRSRNGVATQVFSSNKPYKGNNAVWEWYFLADEWKREGIIDSDSPYPVALEITYKDSNTSKKVVEALNFSRFKKSDIVLLDHDISRCGSAEYDRKIRDNLPLFQIAVVNAIVETAKVTLLRVSNVDISFDNYVVFVAFTLFDRNKFYGEVETPKYDSLIEDAVNSLMTSINGGNFKFDLKISANESISLKVISFKDIERNKKYIIEDKNPTKQGTSSGLVAFLTILATVVGVVLAIALIYLHKRKTITVPYMRKFEAEN